LQPSWVNVFLGNAVAGTFILALNNVETMAEPIDTRTTINLWVLSYPEIALVG
jgi:hypothetical protein